MNHKIETLPDGLSVVVPVFNSGQTLRDLTVRLAPVLKHEAQQFELIFVNDGSRDDSGAVAEELARAYPWVSVIQLSRNYGQHNALLCGVRAARFALVCTIDDDLQHPPEQIPVLLAEINKGHDVVYGAPIRQRHGLARDLASQVSKIVLQNAMGAKTARNISAFRVFRTALRSAFAQFRCAHVSLDVLLTWGTTHFAVVRVPHEPRRSGETNYTFGKLLVHALNMMTGFSSWPLRVASLSGFVFLLFGVGVLIYVLGRYLMIGSPVAGFPFLASIVAIFSGAQLFSLGIIGEYLARIHFRTMDRPTYSVRDVTPPRV